jgi:hypothetical protein
VGTASFCGINRSRTMRVRSSLNKGWNTASITETFVEIVGEGELVRFGRKEEDIVPPDRLLPGWIVFWERLERLILKTFRLKKRPQSPLKKRSCSLNSRWRDRTFSGDLHVDVQPIAKSHVGLV